MPRTNSTAIAGKASSRGGTADVLAEPPARHARNIRHCRGTPHDERAPGGVVQRLIDERAAAGGYALDRIIKR
jgi:hypothetical protein